MGFDKNQQIRMKHITLPDNIDRPLEFYLAMEEFVAREIDEDSAFFLWQTAPTVVCGRNQVSHSEVNVDYCHERGIRIVRRKSGGGCVYSDRGNIMLSCVEKGENVGFMFDRYLRRLTLELRRMGIDAQTSGRNDILVEGKKVSGNAFYKIPNGKCVMHGTLLFDSDFDMLRQAITPSEAKLRSHGVASVRQRVANLKEFFPLGIEVFKTRLAEGLNDGGGTRVLTAAELGRIEEIAQTYADVRFVEGSNPAYAVEQEQAVEGVGSVRVCLKMRHGLVREVHLAGDFFMLKSPDAELSRRLRGKKPEEAAAALQGMDVPEYIANLTAMQLADIIKNCNA